MCDPAQGVTPCVYDVCIHVRGIDFGSLNGDAFSNTCSISSDDVPDQVNLVALLLSSTSAGYFPHLSVLSRSNQWHWRTSDPVVTCEKKRSLEIHYRGREQLPLTKTKRISLRLFSYDYFLTIIYDYVFGSIQIGSQHQVFKVLGIKGLKS